MNMLFVRIPRHVGAYLELRFLGRPPQRKPMYQHDYGIRFQTVPLIVVLGTEVCVLFKPFNFHEP